MVLSSSRCLQRRFSLVSKFLRSLSQQGYSVVVPGKVSPAREVPGRVVKPQYAIDGVIPPRLEAPEIKTKYDIEKMRTSCKLARHVLDKAGKSLRVGMTTDQIDEIVHEECTANNAYPSPLGYKGFPKSVCTSVNNVLCHGIPDDRPLQDGDIINIDVSVFFMGYHGDTSHTYLVGKVDDKGRQLCKVGRQCLDLGISVCRPGAQFFEIGRAISKHASSHGFSVIPQIIGHGIGKYFHGPPDIYHVDFVDEESSQTMQPGMTFTIEPVVCEGGEKYRLLEDSWTLVSEDNSRSCQYEHTVLITDTGVEVLTKFYTRYEEI